MGEGRQVTTSERLRRLHDRLYRESFLYCVWVEGTTLAVQIGAGVVACVLVAVKGER